MLPIDARREIRLEGQTASLAVDLLGGSIVDFHLREQGLNPLVWNNIGDPTAPRQMSHFLCLDRWGWPSAAEMTNGMPYHGEAGLVEWQVVDAPHRAGPVIAACMRAVLPLAGFEIRRWIRLSIEQPVFTVTEEVSNLNRLGTVLNMVQHPSIGPPFLDENTLVDCNAGRGFVLTGMKTNPEVRMNRWPQALDSTGQLVNLRTLGSNHDPEVVSYVVEEAIGWVIASNSQLGLLIGYRWTTADYPWFIAWRRASAGRPLARGIEFGTTGLDWPHGELLRKGDVLGRPIIAFLDAGAMLTKSYSGFLASVPDDFLGVCTIRERGDTLRLIERNGREAREIVVTSVPSSSL